MPASVPIADNRSGTSNRLSVSLADLISQRGQALKLCQGMNQNVVALQAGNYISKFHGRGIDFEEVRLYQPGDDIRHMDWRVTARTGKAHTKVFQEERERPVLVVLDASPSLYSINPRWRMSPTFGCDASPPSAPILTMRPAPEALRCGRAAVLA